jgi:capsid protein
MMIADDLVTSAMLNARKLRENCSAYSIGKANSRWRSAPSSASYYGRDVQISPEELFTSYAVVSELLTTHPMVESCLRGLIANSQISQLRPSANTDDAELNRMLDAEWKLYAECPDHCDAEGKYNYYQLRASAFYLNRAYGDCIGLIGDNTRLQVIEPWRLRSPTRSDKYGKFGILKDANGIRPIRYFLTKTPKSIYDFIKIDDVQPVDARDADGELVVLHPVEPGRRATRGISRLAPVGDTLSQTQDLWIAELSREMLAASAVLSNEISAEDFQILKASGLLSEEVIGKLFDVDARKFKINPQAILSNLPGFQMKMPLTNISAQNFETLWKQSSNMLAVALDIPRLASELDASDANYAQFRAVLIIMRERMREIHNWWITQWDRPIWRHRIRTLMADPLSKTGQRCKQYLATKMGIANLHSEIPDAVLESLMQVRWESPGQEYTQPVHEATGDAIRLAEGLIRPGQYTQTTHAETWDDFSTKQVGDHILMLRKCFQAQASLMQEFGASEAEAKQHVLKQIMALHYTEICPFPRPKQAFATPPVEADPPQSAQANSKASPPSANAKAGVAA